MPSLDFDIWLIKVNANGDFIMVGTVGSTSDFRIVCAASNGHQNWSRTYGGAGFDVPYSVVETPDGGIVVLGYTNSFGSGGADMWLLRGLPTASTAQNAMSS